MVEHIDKNQFIAPIICCMSNNFDSINHKLLLEVLHFMVYRLIG